MKLSHYIKKRLIKTYIWSVVLYGCKTWVINETETEKKTSDALEMWY